MTLRLNPVTRGDLRSRLTSPKILWLVRVYIAVLALLAVFSLPPESGRFPGLAEAELLQVFLLFQLGCVAYLTSALAVGEIAVEGEKHLLDLAVTSFPPRTVALGKLWTALISAAGLVAAALPLVALIAPPAVGALPALVRALLVTVLLAVPLGAVGAWMTAAISSDLLRTIVHWALFLGLFAGTRWLADPILWLNPLRIVAAAYRATPPAWPLALLPYLLIAAGGTILTGRRVVAVRRQEVP